MTLPPISFGENILRPDRLETRNTQEVLLGIRDGYWEDAVTRVRSLPADSPEQKKAKLELPYCTWAGVFTRRCNPGLTQHSGQCGVDLDDLGESGAVAVLQTAVADIYCLAAFRSTRGEGVRLIFRIPNCSPQQHVNAFEQVAEHVRKNYHHEPDTSGRDVARASFLSFDRGLWFNAGAEILPIRMPDDTQRLYYNNRCVSIYAGQLAETWPSWYGRHYASNAPSQDGTVKTHRNLLDLGKAVALHARKTESPLTPQIIEAAFEAWVTEHDRNGIQLRCLKSEYQAEFLNSVNGCSRKAWFKSAAEKWVRWRKHANFPHDGLPSEKILFAIKQHCAESGSNKFFLGARDAALIVGGHFNTAARLMRKLTADGHLEKIGERRLPRHAQTYRLLKP